MRSRPFVAQTDFLGHSLGGDVRWIDDRDKARHGYRGTIDALRPEKSEAVCDHVLAILRSSGVRTLRTDVVFGTATRGPTS